MFSSKACMVAVSLALFVSTTSCWAGNEPPKIEMSGSKNRFDFSKAGSVVKRPSSRAVSSDDSSWEAAWKKYWDGDYDGCIAECDAMIAKDVNDGSPYGLRALAKLVKGDDYGSIADSFHSAVLDPDWSFPAMVKGRAEFYMGDYKSAVANLTKAIELNDLIDTFESDAFFFRGRANESLKDYGNALLDYGTASDWSPTWSTPLKYRCHLYDTLGAKRDCLVDAETLIKTFPDDGDSFRWHGIALEAVGRKADAIAAYQKAKELYEKSNNPDMAKAMEEDIKRLQTSA